MLMILVGGIFWSVIFLYQQPEMEENAEKKLNALASVSVRSLNRLLEQGDMDVVQSVLEDFRQEEEIDEAIVTDPHGTIKYAMDPRRRGGSISDKDAMKAVETGRTVVSHKMGDFGILGRPLADVAVSYPLKNSESCISCHDKVPAGGVLGILKLSFNPEAMNKVFTKQKLMMILSAWVLVLVIAVLVYWLAFIRVMKPVDQISDALDEVSENVTESAAKVATSSNSLAEGAGNQAAAVQETSASLEEISSMVKQNADSAAGASALSQEMSKNVESGKESMDDMLTAMRDIKDASDETAKIISAIDEIAFQTNLLSLNAAVEAARAGEAGAGFAVVAEEVRNLAQHSAQAVENTSKLIEQSIKKVERGVEMSKAVAQVLEDVSKQVVELDGLVNQVAAASREQAQGVDQITLAMTQIDQVTQTTAATSSEAAAASDELQELAARMTEIVDTLNMIINGTNAV